MARDKILPVDEKKVLEQLHKFKCPMPYYVLRAYFMGNIVTPHRDVSPIATIKNIWGGELPEFDSIDDLNELLDVLINSFWNSLIRHQKRNDPFRLINSPIEATRPGLSSQALLRQREAEGFYNGLFNGQQSVDLPKKAHDSLNRIDEIRAMLGGMHVLMEDNSKAASDNELLMTAKNVQQLLLALQHEINVVIQDCMRYRRRQMKQPLFSDVIYH